MSNPMSSSDAALLQRELVKISASLERIARTLEALAVTQIKGFIPQGAVRRRVQGAMNRSPNPVDNKPTHE